MLEFGTSLQMVNSQMSVIPSLYVDLKPAGF